MIYATERLKRVQIAALAGRRAANGKRRKRCVSISAELRGQLTIPRIIRRAIKTIYRRPRALTDTWLVHIYPTSAIPLCVPVIKEKTHRRMRESPRHGDPVFRKIGLEIFSGTGKLTRLTRNIPCGPRVRDKRGGRSVGRLITHKINCGPAPGGFYRDERGSELLKRYLTRWSRVADQANRRLAFGY